MARYRLIIKPRSPFQTPLQSDTMFGHVCWALRYLKGEDKLLDFLNMFNDNNAPLILSSGFPKDYLPMPVLRPLSINEEEMLRQKYSEGKCTSIEFAREMKSLKKVLYIQSSAMEMLKDSLSYYNLYIKNLMGEILLENPKISKTDGVWHNAKNRLTDRVIEGKLFAKQDTFYEKDTELILYIEDNYFIRGDLCEIFDFISKSGYGADKSVGRGKFDYELLDNWDLPELDNPNAFINLSQYHPQKNDFQNGYYDISTKFGKLGGHWASGIDGGPFKMPLLMLNPGSVFVPNKHKSFYGTIIKNVHKQQRIVHYGISLPLKVRVV